VAVRLVFVFILIGLCMCLWGVIGTVVCIIYRMRHTRQAELDANAKQAQAASEPRIDYGVPGPVVLQHEVLWLCALFFKLLKFKLTKLPGPPLNHSCDSDSESASQPAIEFEAPSPLVVL
jgi:hypothetical protein